MRQWKSKTIAGSFILMAILCAVGLVLPKQSNSAFANDSGRVGKVGRNEKLVSQFVWQVMERDHLSKHGVDDEISMRAFDKYIKSLDSTKIYFRQSDINEFSKWKTRLDDQIKAGDYSAAFEVFDRFVQRVDEQTKLANTIVDEALDFSVDEEIVVDPELASYAKNDAEARDALRKRIKYNLLTLRGDDPEMGSQTTNQQELDPKVIMRNRFQSFDRRVKQMDNEDVIEQYITSITSSFDPHTSYMSNKSFDNFMIQMNLELDGIGASLQGSEYGYTIIKSLVPGGAAANQGGLKIEDRIAAVAQGDSQGKYADPNLARDLGTKFVDATGMRVDEVVDMIRGKAGSVVRLSVVSEGESGFHTVNLVREKIKLEDQAARGAIFDDGTKSDGSTNRIGVLELPMFYAGVNDDGTAGRSTTTDVRRILEDFNRQDVDALILDLRNNGGGSLKEAIDCTGLFIDRGPVVQVKNSYGQIDVLNDTDRGVTWAKPMIVLTSKFSASASEILAGAIQDYQRGLIVGDSTTHGKGTVQTLMNIGQMVTGQRNVPNEFGALKLTIQQFYRPDGESTQLRGVLSDIVLPSVTDKMDVSESDLDYPVEFDQIRRANYRPYAMTSPRLIERLGERSASRRSDSNDFQQQLSFISKYVEKKDLQSISLNEEKYLARRKKLKADTDAEKVAMDKMTSKEIKRDFYLDEVLHIASDYQDLLSRQRSAELTAADRS